MQYRICSFVLFLSCAALCASCSSSTNTDRTEAEIIPDSTFQLDVINRLDTLETAVSLLNTQKDTQATRTYTLAEKKAFQQDIISKLDSVEQQLHRLTVQDTVSTDVGFWEGITAWFWAPFQRQEAQEAPPEDSLIVSLLDIEHDSTQQALLQRLDSLQLLVNTLSAPPPGVAQPRDESPDTSAIEAVSATTDSLAALAVTPPATTDAEERSSEDLLNPDVLRKYWGRIFLSIFVFVIFMYTIRGMTWTLDKLAERSATQRLLFKRIAPISKILLWIFAIYVIIVYIFEVTGAALISAGAAAGVALAFAGQDVLKNIFGGLIIIADQPFQVGDKITIGGTYGEVISIGLRSTRIVTSDDNLVSVPNSQVVESQVSNANAGQLHCQVVVDLYLPGWTNATKAKSIAYSAAATSKYVYLDKPIVVVVQDDFKEMSLLRISVKAYVFDCLNELAFKSEVTETAKMEFLRHDMLTPFAYNFRPYLRRKSDGNQDEEAIQQ